MIKTDFWVLREKYTGLFYKKYSWKGYIIEGKLESVADKILTSSLGKARIFPSKKIALLAIPNKMKDMLYAQHYEAIEQDEN